MRKGKPKTPPEDNQRVTLKPIWGIQPKTYIGLIYGIGLGLILFFLLIFPGLFHGGSKVTIHTVPQGASVYVDGVRIGVSPLTTFIKAGSHTIQIRKTGFQPYAQPIVVDRRVLGSLFFPKKVEMRVPLTLESSEALFSRAYDDLASWVLAETPTPIRPNPPVLRNLASDLTRVGEGRNRISREVWNRFFIQCLPQINSEGVFSDFLAALSLVQSDGTVLTHRSLLEILRFFTTLLNQQPNALYWFESIVPSQVSNTIKNNSVFLKQREELFKGKKEKSLPPTLPTKRQPVLRIGPMEFIPIPEGTFYMGWASKAESVSPDSFFMPYQVQVSPFYLLAHEVTEEEFAKFLQETPIWAPVARETLRKQGLVDEGYLSSWKDSSEPPNPSYPVREISYFAAKAYCAWLQTKHPTYRFDLPTEAEWEWAASLNTEQVTYSFPTELKPVHLGERGRWGLRFMLGNVWEWTDDWFAPFQHLFPEVFLLRGVEKIVKGGSYINSPDTITVSTRGSQPPSWCTPYLGFRIKALPR
ncbi:MAG: SUMF1/EgtB/PvdO family nonheme iron enzyme [Spirochaetes bacterium]|nr:SUMF1/EgtB/PvdO family nonheme iron enzyme [Spirochaetota bacterium]